MGKLINVKDTTKCIGWSGMKMKIQDCDDRDISQRFAYSVIDNKILTLRDGRKQATVISGTAYLNSQVNLSPKEIPLKPHQVWTLEKFNLLPLGNTRINH